MRKLDSNMNRYAVSGKEERTMQRAMTRGEMSPEGAIYGGPIIMFPRSGNMIRMSIEYARRMLEGHEFLEPPSEAVLERMRLINADAYVAGAATMHEHGPKGLLLEAITDGHGENPGVECFGSQGKLVHPVAAAFVDSAHVRWTDANGTKYCYNRHTGHRGGTFAHIDAVGVPMAAGNIMGWDGARIALAQVVMNEIHEMFGAAVDMNADKIDHPYAMMPAAGIIFGIILGFNDDQIEHGVSKALAHDVVTRCNRDAKELSDSKNLSAAYAVEAVCRAVWRSGKYGITSVRNILAERQHILRMFHPEGYDMFVTAGGDDMLVMQTILKCDGAYENQSAAIKHGLQVILRRNPWILDSPDCITALEYLLYNPAFDIICNKSTDNLEKKDKETLDHLLQFIAAIVLKRAYAAKSPDWRDHVIMPDDYHTDENGRFDELLIRFTQMAQVKWGGPQFDAGYPDGMPGEVIIHAKRPGGDVEVLRSGRIDNPPGDPKWVPTPEDDSNLAARLAVKHQQFLKVSPFEVQETLEHLARLHTLSAEEVSTFYGDFPLK